MVGGFSDRHLFLGTQLGHIVIHDDGIADNDTHQRNHTQRGRHGEIKIEEPESEGCAEKTQQSHGDGKNGDSNFPIVDDQDNEHDEKGRNDSHNKARQDFVGESHSTSIFPCYTLGEVHLVELAPNGQLLAHLSGSGHSVGRNGDAAQPVAVGHIVVVESRHNVGHLTQRHPHAGIGTGNEQVADGTVFEILRPVAIYLDGNIVVLLPKRGELCAGKGSGEVDGKS